MRDDEADKDISIGDLFEMTDANRKVFNNVANKTTEAFEKQTAEAAYDLNEVVADLIYLLREHFQCHDCSIVNHTHSLQVGNTGKVKHIHANDVVS